MKNLSNLDLVGNYVLRGGFEGLSSNPTADVFEKRIYYNTTSKKYCYFDGNVWKTLGNAEMTALSNGATITIDGVAVTLYNTFTGDVSNSGSILNIGAGKVTNAKLASMGANTIKGAVSAGNPIDLTPAQVRTMINVADGAQANTVTSVAGRTGAVVVNKSDVGLGNVANVEQIPLSQKSVANGVCPLGSDAKVPSAYLPSYVDDVIEGYYVDSTHFYSDSSHTALITGEAGKLYTDLTNNKTYRWGGSTYVELSASLAIGTTSGTAGDGGVLNTHINNSTIHITSAERTSWNAKQDTNVTLSAPTESDTQTGGGTATITTFLQVIINNIKSLFSKMSNHTHNGTDSQKISFNNLRDVPHIPNFYTVSGLTGATGQISQSTHGCGYSPIVQFYLGNDLVMVDINIDSSGKITWSSNISFTSSDNANIRIIGW